MKRERDPHLIPEQREPFHHGRRLLSLLLARYRDLPVHARRLGFFLGRVVLLVRRLVLSVRHVVVILILVVVGLALSGSNNNSSKEEHG